MVRRGRRCTDRRELVAQLVAPAGSTIVCVADGSRAASLARTLAGRGHPVAFLHSDETPTRRAPTRGARAAAGSCVVVGGRIAALAPVPDLAAAIVVDDADEALQEERSPTWHARDVLVERAARAGARPRWCRRHRRSRPSSPCSSRRPSPPPDVEVAGWPRVTVVDRREEPPGAGLLTEPLAAALRATDGLAVCVLNRRGRFRLLVCDACHALLRWDRDADRPVICPACGDARLRVLRAGVTRVGEELAALLPGMHVVDVDADTGAVPPTPTSSSAPRRCCTAPSSAAGGRRSSRSSTSTRSCSRRATAPRRRRSGCSRAAPSCSRPGRARRRGCSCRPACPITRSCARSPKAGPQLVTEAEIARRRALGYPPFGALAELTGDDAALVVAVEQLRATRGARACRCSVRPTAGSLVQAADPDTLGRVLPAALAPVRAAGRIRTVVDPPRV